MSGARLFLAVGVFGLTAIAFGLSTQYWLSFAILAILGMADNVSVYVRGSLVPLATPDALRGRVVAVEAVFIGASNELGAFVGGKRGRAARTGARGSGGRKPHPRRRLALVGPVPLFAPGRPDGIGEGRVRLPRPRPGRSGNRFSMLAIAMAGERTAAKP